MHRHPSSFLAHLRRHRGLWALAVAVLLIKLATSTLCLVDGQGPRANLAPSATASTLPAATPEHAIPDTGDGCVLGEGGDCHCSCVHTVMLPMASVVAGALSAASVTPSLSLPDAIPDAPASLLRPPIA